MHEIIVDKFDIPLINPLERRIFNYFISCNMEKKEKLNTKRPQSVVKR